MSGFSFRGVHSSNFGIYTQDTSRTILPPRREGKVVIPGRSGYYDSVVGNVYDERPETIHCSFKCPSGKTVPEVCRKIAYWLSGTGRLAYDKEPDKYYTARISGGPPMEQHLKYGTSPSTLTTPERLEREGRRSLPYSWPGTCFSTSPGTYPRRGKRRF